MLEITEENDKELKAKFKEIDLDFRGSLDFSQF